MDPLGRRIARLLGADAVITDAGPLAAWESDAFCRHRCRPKAVALPRDTGQVSALLRLLAEAGVPFTPRGTGTGLSGGATAVPGGVVVSLARMDRVLEIRAGDRCARVECGILHADLDRALAPAGLHFAPDPSSQQVCTMGGNIAENAGGPHCFLHGVTVNHVLGLTAVLPGGAVVSLGGPAGEPDLDLCGLFVGSEGTLGVATEAWLRLTPLPAGQVTLLASFRSLRECAAVVAAAVAGGIVPAAMEIMDDRAIATVEASVNRAGFPREAGAVLLIELEGRPAATRGPLARLLEICRREGALAVDHAEDAERRLRLWKGRKQVFGAAGRLSPDLYIMDGVVPRHRLPEALARVHEITARRGLGCTNVAHAGDGNVHPNLNYDGRDETQVRNVEEAGREILEACLELGGTITGEHGVGVEKLGLMARQFGPGGLDAMRRIKAAFDPAGLANPGKLLPPEAP